MRHRKAGRKLGRRPDQRKAMLGNLAMSLFAEERIRTTLPRAKELRSFAEKLLTTAKTDSIHARRLVARVVRDKDVLAKMFKTLGPRYAERPGGYTRIYKLGWRRGDAAEMALIELVDQQRSKSQPTAPKTGGRKLVQRDEASPQSDSASA
jgi:large subunit ribosomal protein L17